MLKRYKDFLTLTKTRRQTYEFTEKEVKDSEIKKILEAARWSPSCGNSQPWRFIVVKNKQRIKELANATYYTHFPFVHPLPPLMIAFVLDIKCTMEKHVCSISDIPEDNIAESQLCLAMSVMNSVLEAEDLGIQSAILTPRKKIVHKILKVKNGDIVTLFVGFGYEKKGAFRRERVRKDLNSLVSYEYYGRKK